jgi:hypothetical protein
MAGGADAPDEGCVNLSDDDVEMFIEKLAAVRFWEREVPSVIDAPE